MHLIRVSLLGMLMALTVGLLVWLSRMPATRQVRLSAIAPASRPAATSSAPPLRIGIIPERDIFEQHRRYRALADYLAAKLDCPIELVTTISYRDMLDEFTDEHLDAAFLGSLATVLAVDRNGALPIVRPELAGNISTYRGVLFVPISSEIRSVDDLRNKRIAMVRTTLAGNLFPVFELMRRGLWTPGGAQPKAVWVGTHDEAIRAVLDGSADAGAAKDLRLDEFERNNPTIKLRRLAVSEPVPENALVVRSDMPATLRKQLASLLLEMEHDSMGRSVLAEFGGQRFIPCGIGDYDAIYDMIARIGSAWPELSIDGSAPVRPKTIAR